MEYSYHFGEVYAYKSPHEFKNRCFPFTVLVFTDSGEYICDIGDKRYIAKEGHLLVVPPFVAHHVSMEKEGRLTWAHVNALNEGIDIVRNYAVPYIMSGAKAKQIKSNIIDLISAMEEKDSIVKSLKTDSNISSIYSIFTAYPKENILSVKYYERIKAAAALIEKEPSREYTLKELAKFSGLSVSVFSKYFKAVYSVSPMKYALKYRLEKAAVMLLRGASVKETALELGFYDAYHFSKQFKKQFLCSPKQYVSLHFMGV